MDSIQSRASLEISKNTRKDTKKTNMKVRFDSDTCLICKKDFHSKACPHTAAENEDYLEKQEITKLIRKIVKEELKKHEAKN